MLIGVTAIAFVLQIRGDSDRWMTHLAMIPVRVVHPRRPVQIMEIKIVRTPIGDRAIALPRVLEPSPIPPWLTLLTCIFLHGSWMHILGNLWFLHIFGNNVEDRLGHVGYLAFYLASGVLASTAHLLTDLTSTVPTVGASGAIAGVMGAYFVFFPHARVLTVVPIIVFLHLVELPAALFLGVWFLLQLFQGTLAVAAMQSAGIAWWAHIGGFAAGALLAWSLRNAPSRTRRNSNLPWPLRDD